MTTTLLTPALPEVLTVDNDVVQSLANLAEGTPVKVVGSKITEDQWESLFGLRSQKHDHHLCLLCQPTWMHFATCSECNVLLIRCQHNPRRTRTAEENAAEIAALKKLVTDENGETIEKASPRQKYLQEVPEELRDTIKAEYAEGAKVHDFVGKYNIASQVLYTFLREEGVLRPKGYRLPSSSSEPSKKYVPTGAKRGRKKTTLALTDELVNQAIELKNSGQTWTEAAKALNLNPTELTTAVKAKGIEVKKGKRSS